jgi:hypothetical protein
MIGVENIGSRRELFVDDHLIHTTTARLALQKPERREVCFRFDAPWEGTGSGYPVLLKADGAFRLYYGAAYLTSPDGAKLYNGEAERKKHPVYACCIESDDGIHWSRPRLGVVDYQGSRDNNIVFTKEKLDNFIPFLDSNPACLPEERFKAFEGGWRKLSAYKSPDGWHWTPMFDGPLPIQGAFDSSNLAFWDATRGQYWAYVRDFHNVPGEDVNKGVRDISWCTSKDFRHWDGPELLDFRGSPDIPLYVSAVTPYYRAPHLFLGFPVRYVERESWSPAFDQLPDPAHRRNRMKHHPRYGLAVTDCVFMSSRDGKLWRRSEEAFLRPGISWDNNWIYGDCYLAIGMQETPSDLKGAPAEISMYAMENHWKDNKELRRYTIRPDGFMALSADAKGRETVTRPFTFQGGTLSLNVSTAAVGGMKVELQEIGGRRIEGFTLEDCDEIFGDRLDYAVSWRGSRDVSRLAGRAVRMRFVMYDTDLYSFRFGD